MHIWIICYHKGNHFPTWRVFIQDSQSLPLITASIFLWICASEVNAPKSAFSTAAPWMVLSQRHSCLSCSLCGLPGNAHKTLFVCFSGGRASAHALKCIFYSCCTISFQVFSLLAHFYTSWWPHHHHIKHDLKKEKTGGGWILVLPILPSLLLPARLPAFPSSLPTSVTQQKPTSEKLTKEMFHKKKFHGTLFLTHAHTHKRQL